MFRKTSRAFCLLFALIICLSSLGGAFAAFTDEGLITYKTAVGVMHGAGVLSGYTDGSFNPKGSITREEAAKLVAFAVLGESGVQSLPRGETGFSDLPGDKWSAPYVAWAAENGIINGIGNGSFNPTGKVTGYQLAKMMLCAAGYGQKGEYSGASWELRTATDGFAKGIFTGIANADPSRSVTREEAALYIFNGISRIEQVVYNEALAKYLPADGTEEADNTIAAEVYGIIVEGKSSTVFSGILRESRANGGEQTVISGSSFDFPAELELVGHNVSVYTNGAEGIKFRVYYISDQSETVTLNGDIAGKEKFVDAFGEAPGISENLLVYDADGSLTEQTEIEGFSPYEFKAPAGNYVFFESELISYMPLIPEFGARIGEKQAGMPEIGGQHYSPTNIISIGSYSEGDVVLARLSGGRINIKKAYSLEGTLEKLERDSEGRLLATVDGHEYARSAIGNKSGLGIGEDKIGSACTVYFDSNFLFFAIETR